VVAAETLKKPDWIRVKAGSPTTRFYEIKQILREHKLHTVCEEASCPNIGECFGKGTATFMIMGDKCTRRCPFCDVGHGRPDPLDRRGAAQPGEDDRGAEAQVRRHHQRRPRRPARRRRGALRRLHPQDPRALARDADRDPDARLPRPRWTARSRSCKAAPPDVMNHNLETAPRLYKEARPGSDYAFSLNLLKRFKEFAPHVPTKSGVMVGLGETDEEILQVMRDMRAHGIDMLTIGQYLAPSGHHLPVRRYVHPDTFRMFEREAAGDGLLARRRRRAGALELPRRPAGARGGPRRHRLTRRMPDALAPGSDDRASRSTAATAARRCRRLALPGHYGSSVEIDVCASCDLVWFDGTETARLNGPGCSS
jgi:lipoic acid synthetase